MSEGMSDVTQRDSAIRNNVIEFLRKRKRRALFVNELSAALRKVNVASANTARRKYVSSFCHWIAWKNNAFPRAKLARHLQYAVLAT